MKIVGVVEAVFRDKDTGEITKTVTKENHIQEEGLRSLMGVSATTSFPGEIFLSDLDIKAQKRGIKSFRFPIRGITVAGLPDKEITYNIEPGIHVIKNAREFAAPAQDYTIQVVGLGIYNSQRITIATAAAVHLDTPCIQTTSEILTVYYQIQVRFDPNWMTSSDPNRFNDRDAQFIVGKLAATDNIINSASYACDVATVDPRKLRQAPTRVAVSSTVKIDRAELFRNGLRSNYETTRSVGKLINSLFLNDAIFGFRVDSVPNVPLQGVFGHNAAVTTPFYNAAAVSSGTGKIAMDATNFDPGGLATYGRIKITATGAAGVSAYQYSSRPSAGFVLNTFTASSVPIPNLSPGNGHLRGELDTLGTTSTYGFFPYPYNGYKLQFLDKDKILISDTLTLNTTILDNQYLASGDVIPRFLPTNIIQVEVDTNKDFWVACGDTGLYFFTEDLLTMNVVDNTTPGLTGTTGCYGIKRGYNNRLWAYFNHATDPDLYFSDDDGATWLVGNCGLHSGDPSVIRGIQTDPSHADHHLLILYAFSISYIFGSWWDHTNQTTETITYLSALATSFMPVYITVGQNMHSFQCALCSPNGLWGCVGGQSGGKILTFNSAAKIGTHETKKQHLLTYTTDENGNDAFMSGTYSKQIIMIRSDGSLEISARAATADTTITSYPDNAYPVFTMFNGLTLSIRDQQGFIDVWEYTDYSPVDDDWTGTPGLRSQLWTDYGWDGASWVEGHAGSKSTHAAAEELMPDVTIAFDDVAGNVDAFIDTDSYTFGLYDGIWMDGSTAFSFDHYIYYKPSKVETSVETSPLPAGLRHSNYLKNIIPQDINAYQDASGAIATIPGKISRSGTEEIKVRSADPVIRADIPPVIEIYPLLDSSSPGVRGYIQGTYYSKFRGYIGITYASELGSAYNLADCPFALDFDPTINGDGTLKITAYQNGIAKDSITTLTSNYSAGFRFIFTHDREIALQVKTKEFYESCWIDVYRTPINTGILSAYYLEIYASYPDYAIFDLLEYNTMTTEYEDLYCYLGNGSDEGVFSTDFFAIDPNFSKIFIDGVEAVNVGEDDTATILTTNTYSIFPKAGIIRYSAADIGKSITAEYTTLTDT